MLFGSFYVTIETLKMQKSEMVAPVQGTLPVYECVAYSELN